MTEEHSTSTIERAVQDGLKSSLVGICSNLALAGFKCVAGFLGHFEPTEITTSKVIVHQVITGFF